MKVYMHVRSVYSTLINGSHILGNQLAFKDYQVKNAERHHREPWTHVWKLGYGNSDNRRLTF